MSDAVSQSRGTSATTYVCQVHACEYPKVKTERKLVKGGVQ
jgi:hypothetical protein